MPNHPSNALDDIVHQRVRLGILAVLAEAHRADFNYLLEALDLTGGNLSRHIRVLEDAGFVDVEKAFEDRKPRTWFSLTKSGRTAFRDEINALRALIDTFDDGAKE